MRVAALVLLCLLVGSAAADGPRTSAIPFDHNVHDRDIVVSGAESLPCTRCHVMKGGVLVGRPDHAACFGSCHGAPPAKARSGAKLAIAADQLRVCMRCHAEAGLLAPLASLRRPGASLAVAFPPYTSTDFALAARHLTHKDVACADCHLARPAPPHRRCAGCHDGTAGHGPVMTACAGCHTPGSGVPDPPRMRVPTNTVVSAFSHPKHAARGPAGAQCTTCHDAIRATDDNILPRPVAASCATAGCHDGKPTFPITRACTRCHTVAPAGKYIVVRSTQRYSHEVHAAAKLPCASCHPLGKTGEALVAGHVACEGCHADDFHQREPKICGACHNANEPWRHLVGDRLPPERSEFGASLDHARHASTACAGCHALTTATAQLRPPRGHAACTTAGCHAVQGGPAPQMIACAGCHTLGLAAKRSAQRLAPAWSVRAQFDHAPHARGKDGASIACATCHVDLSGADVLALAAPTKATCAPCHDGTIAFKLTGTTCTRCHVGTKGTR